MQDLYPIGKRIKDARIKNKLSQAELAKRIHIKQPSLSEIENGYSEPREGTLVALTTELDDDFGLDWLTPYKPKYYSIETLAQMVNEKCNFPAHLEWFVYELAEINEKFKNMIDPTLYSKIYRKALTIKEIFEDDEGLDELDGQEISIKSKSKNKIQVVKENVNKTQKKAG